ncbi:MAG: hypothetical protein ACP5NC_02210 [Nitrososphaeria archaeon]
MNSVNIQQIRGSSRAGEPAYDVAGSVYIGGSWYYVNSSSVSSTTFVSRWAHATNASASSSSSSSTSITASTSSEIPAPLKLVGSVTLFYPNSLNETVSMNFQRNTYYVDELANFTTQPVNTDGLLYYTYSVTPVNVTTGQPVGPTLTGMNSPQELAPIDLFNTIIALPQFNDTPLDAHATHPSQEYPDLPLGPYYNLLLAVGIMVLVPIVFLGMLSPDERRNGLLGALRKISGGILIMLIFPFAYDRIAYLMNTLNVEILAYPMFAVQQVSWEIAQQKLALLETYMILPSSVSPITILETGVLAAGYAVAAVITWIMTFMLGTVRILLLAGMIVMFPLSVALRDFRYTQKLGRIIEDTLFGLMLATVLSSVMLSVATYLLMNWNSPANMFRLAGIMPQWVAITAVITAMVAVTILAPYTATTYQTVSQVGLVAGGVAMSTWMGAVGGGITGFKGTGAFTDALRQGLASGGAGFLHSGSAAIGGIHTREEASRIASILRKFGGSD